VESADKDVWTPLESAALNGHVEVFRELLKHGAELESEDKDVWTTLELAACNGFQSSVFLKIFQSDNQFKMQYYITNFKTKHVQHW